MIMPYLENMINNYKTLIRDSNGIIKNDLSGEWKIHLTMRMNFVSSLDPRKSCIMNSKSDNVEIIMGIENKIYYWGTFRVVFEKLLEKFGRKDKDSNFVFEIVDLLYYILHKITLKEVDHIQNLPNG